MQPARLAQSGDPADPKRLKNGVTSISQDNTLSHTKSRTRACSKGARVVSLPGIDEETFIRISEVDYEEILHQTAYVSFVLDRGKTATILGENGEKLTMEIGGRKSVVDTGMYHRKGDFGNLPAGEAYIAPVEGTANGVVTVDGSIAGVGLLNEPVQLEFTNGRAVDIRGGEAAASLYRLIQPVGEMGTNLAELGVGTNSAARLTGLILEDEKVAGTVHVALGANATFGGKVQVPCHLDLVIRKPTVLIDEILLIDRGSLIVQ